MPKNMHTAFRTEYPAAAKELVNQVGIAPAGEADKMQEYRAVWDTGATLTVVTPKVQSDLGLASIDEMQIMGVNSRSIVPVVLIDVVLPNRVIVTGVRAAVAELGSEDMLLGMNIITLGDLCLSNKGGKTVMSFAYPPFDNPCDLLEKAEAVNARKKRQVVNWTKKNP
ncbi:MAG: retroviral-like aspartic protease family protein [Treponema sp.]|nr:retroviral-like aspartic protease family protein [Treponema sp.]